MHLYGEAWAQLPRERTPDWLPFFLAYDVTHLFQSDGLDSSQVPEDQSWIHEGGADALTLLVLSELGGLEASQIDGQLARAQSSCSAGLAAQSGKPLNASAPLGPFENYYSCG